MIPPQRIPSYLSEILFLLGSEKKKLPKLLAFFVGASFFDLAGLGLIGPYIAIITNPDKLVALSNKIQIPFVADQTPTDIIVVFSLLLLGVFVLKALITVWINFSIVQFSADRQVDLRSRLMRVYQSLPYEQFIQRNSSEYIYNTQTLVAQYSNAILTGGMRATSDLIVSVALLSFLAFSNFVSFLILVLLLLSFGGIYDYSFRSKIRRLGSKANTAADKMVKGINEGISGFKEIRILGREHFFHQQVKSSAEKYGGFHAVSITLSTVPRYLFETVLIAFIIALVLLSIVKGENLQELLPVLGLFGLASVRLLPAASVISVALVQFRFNRDAVHRLWSDLKNFEDRKVSDRKEPITTENFDVLEAKDIDFSYPGGSLSSINGISLKIKRGEAIGIIGSSGSGKTTLANVLLGLLEPGKGEVRFNKKNYLHNLHAWWSNIAYLPQEIFIIDATLKDNIALGVDASEIDLKKLERCVNMAGLTKLVNDLPNGVETALGQDGVRFSGGQKQKVALARAFYHERQVIFMDESTSALDSETEKEIVEEIRNLKGKVTTIIIAHRMTTVRHCDHIYRLGDGKIIESGSPREMLPSLFS